MTNRALIFAIFLFLLILCRAASSDTIFLKNGKQIVCTSVWTDATEVKYVTEKGVVTLPAEIVERIEKETPSRTKPHFQLAASESANPSRKSIDSESHKILRANLGNMYTGMGLAMSQKKDWVTALDYFQKAHRFKNNQDSLFNLARAHFELREDEKAEAYFQELVSRYPDDPDALNYLGELFWRKEELAEAQEYWKKSLALRPDPSIEARLSRLRKEKSASDPLENSLSRHFLIRYDEGNADSYLVTEMALFLEDAYRELSAQYQIYPSNPFVVILYPRQNFFRATDAPLWSSGANDGKIKIPVRGLTGLNTELKEVLLHELSHSFVDLKSGDTCPAWLQEGLAQYSEGKRTGKEAISLLFQLAEKNQLPSFANLQQNFAGANTSTAMVLYLQSLSFTEFLIDRFRFYQINGLLEEIGKGKGVQQAFEATFLVSLSQMEREWKRSLNP